MSTRTSAPALHPPADPLRDYHPLEVIPFFRRFPSGAVRDVTYTFIFNCALALVFFSLNGVFTGRWTLIGLGFTLLMTNLMGYSIHALLTVSDASGLDRRVRRAGTIVTGIYYTTLSTMGVFVGWAILAYTLDPNIRRYFTDLRFIAGTAVVSFIISTILLTIVVLRERETRAEAALAEERVRHERLERAAAHSELRALQAQIEPHFLFNTLANVASLIDSSPAESKRMLERFIRFLRTSLAATRADTTTLAAEGELIAAYLDVLQVRLGERLRFAIDIEPGLAAFSIPPMLLQPVVENAIRHGIEPRVDGGEVRVSARREGEAVRIDVADTGVGFAQATRGGTGLTNLRERLKLLYAERASLSIGDNAGGGAVVTLRIPA